jgi:23S rRNA pseudouridine2457 synthase
MSLFKYLVIYKPFNVLCQFRPSDNKTTLAHLALPISSDMYPVGRLDYDSEGLLIITNDTKLNYKLLQPHQNHLRTYYVQVEGAPIDTDIVKLEKGVTITIDGKPFKTKSAIAQLLNNSQTDALPLRFPPIRVRKQIPATWVSLSLTEGKNRQVRKMTAAIGFPTLRLIRYSIGRFNIGHLQGLPYKFFTLSEMETLLFK